MTTPKISLDPPAPRQAMGAEYYDKVYAESANYAQDYRDMAYYPIWAQTIRIMRAIGEPRILDIGCGVGHLAHYLWDEGFRDYHGFDFSPRAVEMARKRVEQDVVVADAYDPASYEFDYDMAIATEVFEHLDDDLAVVGHLKPGTRLIFSVPTFDDPAHVRLFRSPRDVALRYGEKIQITNLDFILRWFLVSGVVREQAAAG